MHKSLVARRSIWELILLVFVCHDGQCQAILFATALCILKRNVLTVCQINICHVCTAKYSKIIRYGYTHLLGILTAKFIP